MKPGYPNRRHSILPRKSLGQHFLRDVRVVHEILRRADLDRSIPVLEIGPGLGALTFPLAQAADQVLAVEKDPVLAERLVRELSSQGLHHVSVLREDILKWDPASFCPSSGAKFQVIGNLPYNISSPLLERLFACRHLVKKAVLMFQAELARRLVAPPGNREYGAITVVTRYYATLRPLLEVPKEAFYPRPKVDSMVLELDFERPHHERARDEQAFRKVVKAAFSHRRKTLSNSLRAGLPSLEPEAITKGLEACGISPKTRAEVLSVGDFLCLSSFLFALS